MNSTQVAAGGHHTCAIVSGGVQCFGSNLYGQIGDGTFVPAKKATAVMGSSNATAIALGDTHSCAKRADGTVMCWGSNGFGELGDGSTTAKNAPVQVQGLSGVTTIAVGAHHSCALKSDKSVWCWGSNQQGEIGDGTTTNRTAPVMVLQADTVVLRAGGAHTCAIDSMQTLRCWGANDNQELHPDLMMITTPKIISAPVKDVSLGAGHLCRQILAGTYCFGHPIPSGDADGWITPASGDFHTCALQNGTTGCWGADARGQCSMGAPRTPPVAVVEFP
jgi:alpha-tubulin suppressor-like RCC1 family protein